MNRPIASNKSKNTSHNPNTKAQSLTIPAAHIQKCGENFMCIALWAQHQQRDEDSEEAEDMQHEKRAFEFRQQPAGRNVNDEAEENDGPV
jgi:hypothetical protein